MVQTHGPIDTITAKSASIERDTKGDPLVKTCPRCASILALATQQCPDCGYQFPLRDELPRHEAVADAQTNILSKGKAQWVDVDAVKYYVHTKPGSPNSLRVEYSCGFVTHKEWLGFQHNGLMRSKAEQWWLKTGQRPIPATVQEALGRVNELKTPCEICVQPDGKYFRVVGVRFERIEEAAE
jgi:DNA repair protein RadD